MSDQAAKIIELAKANKTIRASGLRWSEDINMSPATVVPALWLNMRQIALDWIDENIPDAFFRSLFESP
jgi:hypothetical protein